LRVKETVFVNTIRVDSRIFAVSLFFIGFSAIVLNAQEVGFRASSEKSKIRMGEPVVITVEGRLPAEVDTVGPIAKDSLGLFQVLNISRDDGEPVWRLEVMTIDTGTVFLPPISFGYVVKGDTTLRKAYANSLMFSVEGIAVPPDADLREIKPPKSAPWKWEDIWPYLLGLVVLGGGYYVYRRYLHKPVVDVVESAPRPSVPPHVSALRELRILEEKKLWQQGKVKEYYSEATEIVRRFFEGRWDIRALEMTTDEITTALNGKTEVSTMRSKVRDFFVRADMVKFAKSQPSTEEHLQELEQATEIVRGMIPPPPPVGSEAHSQMTAGKGRNRTEGGRTKPHGARKAIPKK